MKTIHRHERGIGSGTSATRMLAGALLGMAAIPRLAQAQGCVLCYTSAASGGPGAAQAFRWGVLTLLVPALLLFGGIFLVIFRRARTASKRELSRAALDFAPTSRCKNIVKRLRATSFVSGS